MKHTSNPSNRSKLHRLSARLLVAMAAATSAHAAALTWDSNTLSNPAQDGSGTWATGAGGWWNGSANVNWTAGDTATFGAGTDGAADSYAVTVNGNIAAGVGTLSQGGVHFANSGYSLSAAAASTVTMGTTTTAANLSVASGKSVTIGSNVKVEANQIGAPLNVFGGGTFNIASGGEIKTGSNNLSLYGGTTINIASGGTFSGANSQILIGTNSGSGTVNVNGGTMYSPISAASAQNFILANNTSGTVSGELTINSGLVSNPKNSGGLRFGSSSAGVVGSVSNATLNLNGGTLEIGFLFEGTGTNTTRNSVVNFNGGTLKVLAGSTNAGTAFMTGLDFANVKEGGAVINTNGVATLIGQSLLHGGVAAVDGGLTKNGAGTLSVSGTNTYTGPTSIAAGGLTISSGGSIASTSAIVLSAAATFTNSSSAISKAITLGEGSTIAGSGGVNALGLTVVADLSDGLTSITAGANFAKGTSLDLVLSGATEGTYSVFSAAAAGSFTSVSIAGSALDPVSGGFSATFGGLSYLFTTANDVLTITAVPEPATCAALLGAFALVGAGLRRRSTRV